MNAVKSRPPCLEIGILGYPLSVLSGTSERASESFVLSFTDVQY